MAEITRLSVFAPQEKEAALAAVLGGTPSFVPLVDEVGAAWVGVDLEMTEERLDGLRARLQEVGAAYVHRTGDGRVLEPWPEPDVDFESAGALYGLRTPATPAA